METIQATIEKDDIARYGVVKGCVNNAPVWLLGEHYEAGRVKFLGFRGARNRDTGLYDGVFCVEIGDFPDAKCIDFNEINLRGE